MFVFRFSLRKQKPTPTPPHPPSFPLGFKPRCGEQGASKLVVALVPWLPTPRARWATRCNSWAAGESPGQPSGVSLFYFPLLFYFPSSQVTCVRAGGRTRPSLSLCV